MNTFVVLGLVLIILLIGYLIFRNYQSKQLPKSQEKQFDEGSIELGMEETQSSRGLPRESAEMSGEAEVPREITTVEVFYGTDRERTHHTAPNKMYGGDRNIVKEGENALEYGICEVTIPPNHKVGEIEAPKWWKFEFQPDPEKHVVLQKIQIEPRDKFFQKMHETVRSSECNEAFVFVHGYNTTFEEAALRTGQIAFDLGFDGAPIMYTWPSKGETAAYLKDQKSAMWSSPHLKQFLLEIREKSGADTIHLIAHSMGNQVLTRAFAELSEAEENSLSSVFSNLILTAPDIDAEVFKTEIAPAILKSGSHITLYASSNDLALEASQKLHGNPRAGDSDDDLVVINGIETIDATEVNTSFLGHSYFAESPYIITDIHSILNQGLRASERTGLMVKNDRFGLTYWLADDFDQPSF